MILPTDYHPLMQVVLYETAVNDLKKRILKDKDKVWSMSERIFNMDTAFKNNFYNDYTGWNHAGVDICLQDGDKIIFVEHNAGLAYYTYEMAFRKHKLFPVYVLIAFKEGDLRS